jgi:hypothetical protein
VKARQRIWTAEQPEDSFPLRDHPGMRKALGVSAEGCFFDVPEDLRR